MLKHPWQGDQISAVLDWEEAAYGDTGYDVAYTLLNIALSGYGLFLPVMAVYAVHFNKKMKIALRRSHDRIGDINAQVEDTLAGIRVVKSFTNETIETKKFAYESAWVSSSNPSDALAISPGSTRRALLGLSGSWKCWKWSRIFRTHRMR